jgi:2-polyprenyl-3-methyl-5-hydroxy-6-metoxy-1,4-benzoquinol methylase
VINHNNLEEFADPENYDLEVGGTYGPSAAFYTALAAATGGPALDLACGSGLSTMPLARLGLATTGLDLAEGMLAHARRKAEAEGLRVEWVHGDVRRFQLGRRFRFIQMTGNAFQAMLTEADQLALLARVAEHLAPGGRFAFETRNPSGHDLSTQLEEEPWQRYVDTAGRTVTMTTTQVYDAEAQVLHWTVYRRWEEGGASKQRTGRIACRFTGPEELGALFARAGLALEAQYGDWDQSPLSPASYSIISVLRLA